MKKSFLILLFFILISCGDNAPLDAPKEEEDSRGLTFFIQRNRDTGDPLKTGAIYGEIATQITKIDIEEAAGGIFLKAEGVTFASSPYAVSLRPVRGGYPNRDKILSYELRLASLEEDSSLTQSRLKATRFIPYSVLSQAKSIHVRGKENTKEILNPIE